MQSRDIRTKFLEFFKSKEHKIVTSDSLVPKNDPTLLFTSAGMNQFKEQFLGHNVTYSRAATCQKCLRTADLERVGKTPSHHTFFEMLGNFSFGDYFKKEAIELAWEFMTGVMGLREDALWVSVYEEDEESFKVWRDLIKVSGKRIVKLGAKENFWPSNAPLEGPNGPCGPCSEIFFDRGKNTGCGKKTCSPACDCGRFVEVWNLVFTQFERKGKERLEPLPKKNIDTGMGLERMAAVKQGVKTNFKTDLFRPIIDEIKVYRRDLKSGDLNAIADHVRAITFAIADGVAPSNEERGYVVRKLIRRAYTRAQAEEPFLYYLVPKVVSTMKDAYPELLKKREEISLIVKEEEERFENTLGVAIPILEDSLEHVNKSLLGGDKIFKLVDTYGLPLEIIEDIAGKKNIALDMKAFERLMKEQKELSREKSKIEGDIFSLNLFAKAPRVPSGDTLPLKGKIAFLVRGKERVKSVSSGETVELMTDPQAALFYAEAGGQLGDTGTIEISSGRATVKILNTVAIDKKIVHVGRVTKGEFKVGDPAMVCLDSKRKEEIAKNHTATHLLHSALRKVLGEHVHQAGSLVRPDRLRFDFTHIKKVTERELEMVENIVNESIKKAIIVKKEEKSLREAKKESAIALFGEKYDEKVMIISAGDVSKEVCGGTHVNNTKEIGLFRIVRESSVASGIRRIEAVTSFEAEKWLEQRKEEARKSKKDAEEKERKRNLEREKLKKAEGAIEEIVRRAKIIKDKKVLIEKIENANIGILRSLADRIKSIGGVSFLLFGSADKGKANIVLALGEDIVRKGYNASDEIKEMAKMVEGSGGGRPDFAQAGGKDPARLDEVFSFAENRARDIIGGISK